MVFDPIPPASAALRLAQQANDYETLAVRVRHTITQAANFGQCNCSVSVAYVDADTRERLCADLRDKGYRVTDVTEVTDQDRRRLDIDWGPRSIKEALYARA